MAAKRRDHKGHKYGHLTLLYPTRSGGSGKGVYWMGKCDCGQIKEVRGSDAANGKIKSCGSCAYHTEMLEEAAYKSVKLRGWTKGVKTQHLRYIRSAVKRGIEWRLSPEEFLAIIKKDCTYCKEGPRVYEGKFGKRGKTHKTTMNGIDRIDSHLGYVLDNVVPCCGTCNKMKMAMDESVFRIQILKIAKVYIEKAHLDGESES
jgi:hypothetical protein